MKFICLASSSAGNCYYVEIERVNLPPVKLMLEVGIPFKEIMYKGLNQGIKMSEINAAVVTHGHGDHCCAAKDFVSHRIPFYANEDVLSKCGGNPKNRLIHNEMRYLAKDTLIIPFNVEHDAPNSLGFVICTDKETLLFVNDCKFFKADLSDYKFDYVCIEANYDGQQMHFAYEDAKQKNDYQNIARYERLFDSHMSLAHCRDHLKKLNLSQCKAIFLMHLSDRHANENKFKETIFEATGINTYVCKKNGGIV